MKTLSTAKPQAIIMIGLPGAGKSFFARQFAETFNAPLISYDRIRYELFNQPSYSHDEESIISRVAYYMIGELIKTGRTIIIDGGHNARNDRYELGRSLKRKGYDTMLCWVQTDISTCQQRAMRRNPRKKDDMLNASMSLETFKDLSRRFTPPAGQEKFIVISGKHTYPTQARMVLRRLAEPRQQSAVELPARPQPSVERRINVVSDDAQAPPPRPARQSISIN